MDYQKHVVMAKQGKVVGNNKIINQTMVSQGIGRMEAGVSEVFVLTRKADNPELIFNDCRFKDLYWEMEAGEKWQLSYKKSPTNECFVCQKYKYGLIFVDKRADNSDLEEIKDPEIIAKVAANLNLEADHDGYAPIICGSIVNGGFNRKLKMLRSDLFSLLSVCKSEVIIT